MKNIHCDSKLKDRFFLKKTAILFLSCFMGACFYFTDPMRKAEKALDQKDCRRAKEFFILAPQKEIVFVRKAAQKCATLSLKEAIWFYDYLSYKEETLEKRVLAREQLAHIYFEEIKDYEKAIELYSFLRAQVELSYKRLFYSFRIAFSFFELGKWQASLTELSRLEGELKKKRAVLRPVNSGYSIRNIDFLKARVFLMQKRYEQAEEIFRKIQKNQPEYFKENKLFFYLSFIYESKKEFHQAISELENFENTSHFLSDKIERLKVRQKNQPGSL